MAKKFNFEEVANSPIVKQTEEKITKGYQEMLNEEESSSERQRQNTTVTDELTTKKSNERKKMVERKKGIATNLPMSLYNRMVLYKLNTGMNLGEIVENALENYLDAQEDLFNKLNEEE